MAVFGTGPVTPPIAKLSLVAHVLNVYYPPNLAPDFEIQIRKHTNERWAGLTPSSGPNSKPVLAVTDDVFWLTPAFLVSALGHEMVHAEQFKRLYKTNLNGINPAVQALRELEAYSWQLQKDNFPRGFKVGLLTTFMKADEQNETKMNYQCSQWETLKAVEDVETGPRQHLYAPKLDAWLKEDPWVSQVWLPQNPNWAHQHAGPEPPQCK